MTIFRIDPWVGAHPLKFGMSFDEVTSILGSPASEWHSNQAAPEAIQRWQGVECHFSGDPLILDQVVFIPSTFSAGNILKFVYFADHCLADTDDLLGFLSEFDEPEFSVGAYTFNHLGISLTISNHDDFDDDIEEGAVISIDTWSEHLVEFLKHRYSDS